MPPAATLALVGLGLASSAGCAKHNLVCQGIEVLSMTREATSVTRTEGISVTDSSGVSTADAIGPVLGETDSKEMKIEQICGPEGLQLTATIIRDATIDVRSLPRLKSSAWRPKVSIDFVLQQPQARLLVTWAMRLSDGTVRDYYPDSHGDHGDRRYPITMSKVLYRPTGRNFP
jgi:hypothetical protein